MEDKMQDINQESRKSAEGSRKTEIATEEEAKIVELIIFKLGDEEFAADIEQVREIIRKGTITPIPDSPDFIKGVTNVRGEITVVINLKARFFLPIRKEVESKHIVITEQDKNLFGLMVDEVTEVLRIPENEVKPTPELVTRTDRVYIRGVITLENRLIIFIDLAKVLQEEDLTRLAKLAEKRRGAEEGRERKTKAKETSKAQITQKETPESADKKKTKEIPKEQATQQKTEEFLDEKKAEEAPEAQVTQEEIAESADEKKAKETPESADEKKAKGAP